MDKPLISIVVPVYNVEKYINRCINSIIRQEYQNIEIILVDDGSFDNSGKICDEYAKKDERIVVVHQKNRGLSAARNCGIDISKGEYICFVDSDDWISSDYVSTLFDLIINNNADIAVCSYVKTEKENDLGNNIEDNIIEEYNNIQAIKKIYSTSDCERINIIIAWNKLYNKRLFENIRYPQNRYYEDGGTTYKLLYNSEKIVCLKKVMYYYFVNCESITGSKLNKKKIIDAIELQEEELNFYKNKNLDEMYVLCYKRLLEKLISLYYESGDGIGKEISEWIADKYKFYYKRKKQIINSVTTLKTRIRYMLFFINRKIYKWLVF